MYDYLKDLMEYYNVTKEQAIELGTRKQGRKPNLPGSRTCQPVNNLTFEDIWDIDDRTTEEGIFKFYKDQGAWSSFRQCIRHKDMINYHIGILNNILTDNFHLCEYGCGVAPFSYTLLNLLSPQMNGQITISDVNSEHFEFAKWRLAKLVKDKNLNVQLNFEVINPGELPTYVNNFTAAIIFEVLEHVPSPMKTIENITNSLQINGALVENFIQHVVGEDDDDDCDLKSAANERSMYYSHLDNKYELLSNNHYSTFPDQTRIWRKK